MQKSVELIKGKTVFSLGDLFAKVAAVKGLELLLGTREAYSSAIKTYKLTSQLLAALAKCGFRAHPRPDITSLMDENPQPETVGIAHSHGWSFGQRKKGDGVDMRVTLSVFFVLNIRNRGIELWPQAHGTVASATSPLANFRLLKALADNDVDAPDIIRELAGSDGIIVVSWTELGLGGLRSVKALFQEFAGDSEAVQQLGLGQKVFVPMPCPPQFQSRLEELFVVEPAQPSVFKTWQEQLKRYRESLKV